MLCRPAFTVFFLALILASTSGSIEGPCPVGQSVTSLNNRTRNIFDDLSDDEITAVVNYTRQIVCFNQPGDVTSSDGNITTLAVVELRPPTKHRAVQYLDAGGPAPARNARVVLYRGDMSPPVVQEYEVGPLPHPSGYLLISRTHWRDPIPYTVRPYNTQLDGAMWDEFICRQLTNVNTILRDVTGWTYSAQCDDHCLTYSVSLPAYLVSGTRSMWIVLRRRVDDSSLHPIGFEFRVNMTSLCPCAWLVDYVWFRNVTFDSIDQLKHSYDTDPDVKQQLHESEQTASSVGAAAAAESSGTSQRHAGESSHTGESRRTGESRQTGDRTGESGRRQQRAPRCYAPDGRRFTVAGRHVTWLNWKFYFNIRTTTGPIFNDIRFRGQRIVYELALQELLTLNSGWSPAAAHAAALHSIHLLGSRAYELYPDVDCPADAYYFDAVHYVDGAARSYRRSACVFEQARATPLRRRRRRERGDGRVDGLTDNVLVVRTIIVVDDNDYIIDVVLHQNAVIEAVCSVSGALSTHYYFSPDTQLSGYQVKRQSIAYMYNRLVNFKVDLDVYGQANRVEHVKMVNVGEKHPDMVDPSKKVYVWRLNRELKQREKETLFKHSLSQPMYVLVSNANETNRYGNPRAYRILPLTMSSLMFPKQHAISKAVSWAFCPVVMTKRKDDEDTSSTIYNAMDHRDPVLDFQKYINDNENIVDEDVTVWITLGALTIPHSEDVPTIQTAGSQMSFVLQPFNYFDEDPSQYVDDAVNVVAARNTGRLVYQRHGDVDPLLGDVISRDVDCVPVMVRNKRKSAAAGRVSDVIMTSLMTIMTLMVVTVDGRN